MAAEVDFGIQREQEEWRRKIDSTNFEIDNVIKEIFEYGIDYYAVSESDEDLNKFSVHDLPIFENSFFNLEDTHFNLDLFRTESSRKVPLVKQQSSIPHSSKSDSSRRTQIAESYYPNSGKANIHHAANGYGSNGHSKGPVVPTIHASNGYSNSTRSTQFHLPNESTNLSHHFELDHIGKSELLDDLEVELGWPLSVHTYQDIEHFPEPNSSFGRSDSLEIPKLEDQMKQFASKLPQIHEKSPTKDFVSCIVAALEEIQPATSQQVLTWLLQNGSVQLSQKMNYESLKKKIQSLLGHKLYKETFSKIPQQTSTAALWQLQHGYKQALAANAEAENEMEGDSQHLTIEHNEHIFSSQPDRKNSSLNNSSSNNNATTDSGSDVNEDDFDFESENDEARDEKSNPLRIDSPRSDDSSQLSEEDSDEEIDVLEVSDTNTETSTVFDRKEVKVRRHSHNHQRSQKRLNEESWNDHFAELIRFQNQFKHFSVPTKGEFEKLYQWIKRQRAAKRNNKASLTQERIRRLNDIGFPWQPDRKKMKTSSDGKTITIEEKVSFNMGNMSNLNLSNDGNSNHSSPQSSVSSDTTPTFGSENYKVHPTYLSPLENEDVIIHDDDDLNEKFLQNNNSYRTDRSFSPSEEFQSDSSEVENGSSSLEDNDWIDEPKTAFASTPEKYSKKRPHEPSSPTLQCDNEEGTGQHYHNRLNGERWDERFAELLQFFQEQGHCKVPRKGFPELNRWIHKQLFYYRQKSGAMTLDRYNKLQRVAFWDTYK